MFKHESSDTIKAISSDMRMGFTKSAYEAYKVSQSKINEGLCELLRSSRSSGSEAGRSEKAALLQMPKPGLEASIASFRGV